MSLFLVQERFMNKVLQTDTCWNWTGYRNSYGYGKFCLNKKIDFAHRVSFTLFKGEIPKGMCILHSCDNPRCVRPQHIRLGTHKENMEDKVAKNRQHKPNGELNGRSKLKNHDVSELLVLHAFGFSGVELAKQFDISIAVVSTIINNRSWKHIAR